MNSVSTALMAAQPLHLTFPVPPCLIVLLGLWNWLQLSQLQLFKTEEWGKKLRCESVILIWLDSINIIIYSNKYTALSL